MALFREPLPTGLVELNLLLEIPFVTRHPENFGIGDVVEECTYWAASVVPSLRFSCRSLGSEGRLWEDFGPCKPSVYNDDRNLNGQASLSPPGYGEDVDGEDDPDQDERLGGRSTPPAHSQTSKRPKLWGLLRRLRLRPLR